MRSDLEVLAEILGANSTAAVTFRDRRAGEELLASLKARKHITAAVIYLEDGTPFARYQSGVNRSAAPAAFRGTGTRFEGDTLIVCRNILLAGQNAGFIYLQSDLEELTTRLLRFATIVFIILLISSGIALALSTQLQRLVSDPIAHLARVTRRVAQQKDYTVRAVKQSDDDLGQLIDTFNGMLAEIESRDAAPCSKAAAMCWSMRSRLARRNWCWPKTAPKPPAAPKANSSPT